MFFEKEFDNITNVLIMIYLCQRVGENMFISLYEDIVK